MSSQLIFAHTEFADNPEPRCPCVLVLDVSGSMSGAPIDELNRGLATFRDSLLEDRLAAKRVEVAVVTFGPVKVEQSFISAANFYPNELHTQGVTPMGEAIHQAIHLVEERKQEYRANGIQYYRPWIFLITDGAPTDSWQNAAVAVKEGELAKKFMFFSVGVKGADMNILGQIGTRPPLALDGLKFQELFSWLSRSLSSISQSTMGTQVTIEKPSEAGWTVI
jgi:uncharacterized protein YegL